MKINLLFVVCLFFSVNLFSQDTIIVKKDNKLETVLCKITKVTPMTIFYTENKIGKSIEKKNVNYFSNHPIVQAPNQKPNDGVSKPVPENAQTTQEVNSKSTSTNSQIAPKRDSISLNMKGWRNHSPGKELMISSRHYYTGLGIMVAGAGVTAIGEFLPFNRRSPAKTIETFGGIIGIIGMGFVIESHIHIKRAGIIMNNDGIGVRIPLK